MDRVYIVKKGQELTEEQKREVEEAAKRPIVFDDDCPELSPEMIKVFECVVDHRNRRKRK